MNSLSDSFSDARRVQTDPNRSRRVIGPVAFELTDRDGAIHDIVSAVSQASGRVFAFCNMHTFNMARRSHSVANSLKRCTVFNDGVGIDVASRILFGDSFPANLNGTDLTSDLLAKLPRPVSIYLIGSPPGIAQEAARAIAERFPGVKVVGTRHGYLEDDENHSIAQELRASGAQLVLVGMGNPRQELWASHIAGQTGAVILCVGAYIDFLAGRFSRAPLWVRRIRCEWMYRLALEPSRLWRRYLVGGFLFLCAVMAEKRALATRAG